LTTGELPENLRARIKRLRTPSLGEIAFSLEDIEETQTSLWVGQQLDRIHDFLVEYGADSEMLDAIKFLRDDNDSWINPKIAESLAREKCIQARLRGFAVRPRMPEWLDEGIGEEAEDREEQEEIRAGFE